MRRLVSSFIVSAVLLAPGLGHTSMWGIDPAHTNAQFAVRHMMVSTVRGEFGKVSGNLTLDEQDPTKSTIEATIDATSINTRVEKRDEHLKSPDFFDVAKYPTITFKSKKIEGAGQNKFKVIGDLTLHGVTKEVVLTVEGSPQALKDPTGTMRIGGSATTKINRKDFGLAYNKVLETGGMLVGDEVDITIDVELTKKPDVASAATEAVGGAAAHLTNKAVQAATGGEK